MNLDEERLEEFRQEAMEDEYIENKLRTDREYCEDHHIDLLEQAKDLLNQFTDKMEEYGYSYSTENAMELFNDL
jgi:hypothetical protein